MTRGRMYRALTVLCMAFVTHAAHAQSSSAQAESLFVQARELMAQKKYAEACNAFASSQKLEASATTLFSHAVCRELNGQFATAWGLFIDVERQYRNATDPAALDLARNAGQRSAKLEPRLSKLVIDVPATSRIAGLAVHRDNDIVDEGTWGRGMPLDPGPHTIVARSPGHDEWKTTITIAKEGETQTVSVPTLGVTAVVATPVVVSATPSTTKPRSRVVPFALLGGAVALGGGAVGFELWGRSLQADAEGLKDTDYDRAQGLHSSANTRRYIAQGMGIAAVGCAGVAIFMLLRGDEQSAAARASRLQLTPVAGRELVGVSVGHTW